MLPLIDFLRQNAHWLLAGFLLTFASSFGQTFFIAVFAGEIRAEFNLTHGQWGGIYALATTASALVMVQMGGLTDRLRVRVIGIGVLLGLAGAALSMAVVSQLWALVVVIFLLRLMGQGMMSHVAMVAMARWFIATRGRAVSIAGLGVATGEALLPLGFVALMGVFDWRMLWVGAAITLALLAPILLTLLYRERTPQSFATDSGAAGFDGTMWTRARVLRHPVFWCMLPALLGPAAWNTAFFFHQVHLAEAKGWQHVTLVAMFPVYTSVSISFMLIAGWLIDRFGSRGVTRYYLLLMAVGYVVFGLTATPLWAGVALAIIGGGVGIHVTLMSTLWADLFGTRHLGSIRAMQAAFMVLGTAIGPAATGTLIDLGLTFPQQSFGIAFYFLGATSLAFMAMRKVAEPGQKTA